MATARELAAALRERGIERLPDLEIRYSPDSPESNRWEIEFWVGEVEWFARGPTLESAAQEAYWRIVQKEVGDLSAAGSSRPTREEADRRFEVVSALEEKQRIRAEHAESKLAASQLATQKIGDICRQKLAGQLPLTWDTTVLCQTILAALAGEEPRP